MVFADVTAHQQTTVCESGHHTNIFKQYPFLIVISVKCEK